MTAVTLLGAGLRFGTLGRQSYDDEEAYTLRLLHGSFGHMLSGVAHQESTPPTYYGVAWIWSRAFGTGEFALRSPSAIAGTLLVPVSFLAAYAFLGRPRPALAVATITAVSPILIWYSQDARSYAFYALSSALTLLFFARLRENPSRSNAIGWAAASIATIWIHYLAGFLVLGEALLLARAPNRRRFVPALTAVGISAALAVPLAAHQYVAAKDLRSFTSASIAWRLWEVPLRFIFFYYNPGRTAAAIVAITAAAILAYRGRHVGSSTLALGLGGFAVALPCVLAAAAILDVFFFRNVLAAWLTLLIPVAAGFERVRFPSAAIAAVAVIILAISVQSARKIDLQRDSWRVAVTALRVEHPPLVVTNDGVTPPVYWPALRALNQRGVNTGEVDLAGRYVTSGSELGVMGFQPTRFRRVGNIGIRTFVADRPHHIVPEQFQYAGLVAFVTPTSTSSP
jgi:mannosyltransferase